jgi:hypothetical protein
MLPAHTAWRVVAACYVVLEGVLGAVVFGSVEQRSGLEWTAFLLLIPGVVVTLPFIYFLGAMAWNVPASSLWFVGSAYSALFIGAAVVNVAFLCRLARAVRRPRQTTATRT